jgi:hypothetical protein
MIKAWPLPEPTFIVEEITDPAELARRQAQDERARRNSDWLQAHWKELLPRARGKFLAVAGQEAFLGDTPEEAWARARAAHAEDDGAISQYVPAGQGPRIYASRRRMAALS